jgi:GNAT superfamily N-acetyltransferase
MSEIVEWGPERLPDLAGLVEAALPSEGLTADELLACGWDDPGVVLGLDDGSAAVAATLRSFGDVNLAWCKLVVVDPSAQRHGLGRRVVGAVEQWAFDGDAVELHLSGSPPFYLWPGVDTSMLGMLCLAEACGYEPRGTEINMALPTAFRAAAPAGVTVRRPLGDVDVDQLDSFVATHWPEWSAEFRRAVEQGGCHGAWDESTNEVEAFACHSVNRAGWVGPMGSHPQRRGRGVGFSLLGEVCRDLMVAGMHDAEICWVGPVRFYAKAGASVSRTFRTYRKRRP